MCKGVHYPLSLPLWVRYCAKGGNCRKNKGTQLKRRIIFEKKVCSAGGEKILEIGRARKALDVAFMQYFFLCVLCVIPEGGVEWIGRE